MGVGAEVGMAVGRAAVRSVAGDIGGGVLAFEAMDQEPAASSPATTISTPGMKTEPGRGARPGVVRDTSVGTRFSVSRGSGPIRAGWPGGLSTVDRRRARERQRC
ncbi:hypothetical protein GCM10010441_07850 [Kitasatospora paracochleata]